ncbi:MAG: CopG family antitoxin [Polaromonas sp.]
MTKLAKPTGRPVTAFATEADERAYWETGSGRDSTEHLDWSKARKTELPILTPTTKTISLQLPQACQTP